MFVKSQQDELGQTLDYPYNIVRYQTKTFKTHKKKLKISHLKCTEKFNCDEVNDIYSWKRFKAELAHKLLDTNL